MSGALVWEYADRIHYSVNAFPPFSPFPLFFTMEKKENDKFAFGFTGKPQKERMQW